MAEFLGKSRAAGVAGTMSDSRRSVRALGRLQLAGRPVAGLAVVGRRLSQVDLANGRVAERIVGELGLAHGDVVVELGAGCGALTGILRHTGAYVVAVEVDAGRCRGLKRHWPDLPVVCQDLLTFTVDRIPSLWGRKPSLIGNLPYHITGPALLHIASESSRWHRGVFTLQREVARRLVASPGNRTYGRLTVAMNVFVEARLLFHVAPGSFRPPPKVRSAVVELVPRESPLVPPDLQGAFGEVVRGAFAQRRKMLRNTPMARGLEGPELETLLARRAEELSVADFTLLARAVSSIRDPRP